MDGTLDFTNDDWGRAFNPNNATQTRSIFVEIFKGIFLKENTFLGMTKVRA